MYIHHTLHHRQTVTYVTANRLINTLPFTPAVPSSSLVPRLHHQMREKCGWSLRTRLLSGYPWPGQEHPCLAQLRSYLASRCQCRACGSPGMQVHMIVEITSERREMYIPENATLYSGFALNVLRFRFQNAFFLPYIEQLMGYRGVCCCTKLPDIMCRYFTASFTQ